MVDLDLEIAFFVVSSFGIFQPRILRKFDRFGSILLRLSERVLSLYLREIVLGITYLNKRKAEWHMYVPMPGIEAIQILCLMGEK